MNPLWKSWSLARTPWCSTAMIAKLSFGRPYPGIVPLWLGRAVRGGLMAALAVALLAACTLVDGSDASPPASTPTSLPAPTARPQPTLASTLPPATAAPAPSFTPRPTDASRTLPVEPQEPQEPPFLLRSFANGSWLRQTDPRLASAINGLAWIQDDIDDAEAEAVQDLLYIAVESRSMAASIVSLGWVQDGIGPSEAAAIRWINNTGDLEVASAVVSLGWVQDGIDGDLEVATLEELSYMAYRNASVAASIVSLGWVQDGIDGDMEVAALEELSYMAYEAPQVASSVVSLGWVQDGIEAPEDGLLDDLASLSGKDATATLLITGMPFLETVEPHDLSATGALRQLAAFNPDSFQLVMSHPTVQGGITDDLTPVVATLRGVATTNAALISVLLEPGSVLMEQRTVALPLAGDVGLSIIRTRPGADRSMDLLEHAVRQAESYMEAPLPTNHVVLLFEEAVLGSFAGTNFGSHIAIRPKFDVDDGSHEAVSAGNHIAHESAHYYWSKNADWVDEGAADFLTSIIENVRTGQPVRATNTPCPSARNISDLEKLDAETSNFDFYCNYSLGERLFLDLHHALGDDRFRQGFRDLYLASTVEDDADDFAGTAVDIRHVGEAFSPDDELVSAVIARWYDGTGPYDLSRLDTSPVSPELPAINGRIDQAYVSLTSGGPAVSQFSAQEVADWVYLTLGYAYSVSGGQREAPLEILESYEDGFVFDRRSMAITAEPGYVGGTQRVAVGPAPPRQWAPGRYVVQVYSGEDKVAEVEFMALP